MTGTSVKNNHVIGIDGGISSNNPSLIALTDSKKIFDKNDKIFLLSFGNGLTKTDHQNEEIGEWGILDWIVKGKLVNLVMDGHNQTTDYILRNMTELLDYEYLRIDNDNNYEHELYSLNYDDENIKNIYNYSNILIEKYADTCIKFLTEEEARVQ